VKIGSQDMSDAIWLKLAKRVNALLKSNEVDAVVVTLDTDMMLDTDMIEETAISSIS
jgi:L-asparaginase